MVFRAPVLSISLVAIYVASDLHLDEEGDARLFHAERQGRFFIDVCHRLAREAGSELVLLGDVFDFTAMTAPRKGLAEFQRRMKCALSPPPDRPLRALLEAVRASNERAFEAIGALAKRIPVTIVPGNHDRRLLEPGARAALDDTGLGDVRIAPYLSRDVGGAKVLFVHGHEWDSSNATPLAGGELMTEVLHQALVPYLRQVHRKNVRIDPDRVVSLRPEEHVFTVLQRWLEPRAFKKLFDAMLELLVENGALPRPVKWFLTADRVRRRTQAQDDLWVHTGRAGLRALAGREDLPDRLPPPDVLVAGHTHVLDWAVREPRAGLLRRRSARQQLYVNLGTWTDRTQDESGPEDDTLPLLALDGTDGTFHARLENVETGMVMQSFEQA